MANDPGTASLRVEVCLARPEGAWRRALTLPAGATAAQALQGSGFAAEFPGIDPWTQGVGIYGKTCRPDTPLADGDRLEIYRPLTFDPKESRRRRVEHRRAKQAQDGRERPAGLL